MSPVTDEAVEAIGNGVDSMIYALEVKDNKLSSVKS